MGFKEIRYKLFRGLKEEDRQAAARVEVEWWIDLLVTEEREEKEEEKEEEEEKKEEEVCKRQERGERGAGVDEENNLLDTE